jgi:uncharacterized protein
MRVGAKFRDTVALGLLLATSVFHPACGSEAKSRRSPEGIPLVLLGDTLAICRVDGRAPQPSWAAEGDGEFSSVTRTRDELSIIVSQARAPQDVKCERNWRLFKVRGPLPLNLVGIIAGLSGTLADARVSIFAISTYDTDYIMVKQTDLASALQALQQAGYTVRDSAR